MAGKYDALIEEVFFRHYKRGVRRFEFTRAELEAAAKARGVSLPKNLGDVIYSYRFRKPYPDRILKTCGPDEEWIIEGAGVAKYVFRKVRQPRIEPKDGLYQIKVPDATPEIISKYALGDEQALLAKLRYNRLIDVFTGVAAYSLQSHLRTQVKDVGQIEVDELYVGVSKSGAQFIIPVQAKGGADKLGVVQVAQDMAFCKERFPGLICRPIATQFMAADVIAMFELTVTDGEVRIVEERHYKLVPASEITPQDLKLMAQAHK